MKIKRLFKPKAMVIGIIIGFLVVKNLYLGIAFASFALSVFIAYQYGYYRGWLAQYYHYKAVADKSTTSLEKVQTSLKEMDERIQLGKIKRRLRRR